MSGSQPYAVLQIRDFRLPVVGRLLVPVGIQIQSMAVGWQIYALTKDPLSLGIAGLAEVIPSIGVALYAGHLADVRDRKTITVFTVAAMTCTMFGLACASFLIHQAWILTLVIYLCVALSGLTRGFYGPALFGLVSQIVPREQYANASAWNSAVWQWAAILGPLIGGAAYVAVAAPATYAISATLVLIGLFLFYAVSSKTELSRQANHSSTVESIKEGLRFVFAHEVLLAANSLDLFAVLFGGAVALLPIFAAQVFHSGPEALGILRAAPSVGALITATILTYYPIRKQAGWLLLAVVAGFGLCMIGFGLSSFFWLSVFLLVLSGLFDGVSIYIRSTISQLATPDNMKGRVAAVNSVFIGSSNEIGEFESGVTAKLMGTVPSVVFGGCMTLLVVAITAFRSPKLRALDLWHLERDPEA